MAQYKSLHHGSEEWTKTQIQDKGLASCATKEDSVLIKLSKIQDVEIHCQAIIRVPGLGKYDSAPERQVNRWTDYKSKKYVLTIRKLERLDRKLDCAVFWPDFCVLRHCLVPLSYL